MATFESLNLNPDLKQALESLGFEEPTKIQERAIPLIQSGKDVSGLAQTGTGKTAAFLMPVLQRLYASQNEEKLEGVEPFEDWQVRSQILVLVPTRELAEQVASNLKDLSPKASYVTVYGGVSYDKQKKYLKEGVQFVIATPGRLIDLYKEKYFDPNLVRCVIFDEADRMFDMGFKDDMKYLLDRIPRTRQFLVFSATLNFDVLTVAYEYGSNPVEIEVDRDELKADQVRDEIFHVGHNEKPQFLLSLLKAKKYEQAVVFTNFVRNVAKIEKFLKDNELKAIGISSALSQHQRTKVMDKFRNGEINVLVATDVAARGLDIENVDLVLNFELPDDSENYIHRIGRTGRAGREGEAYSLVSEKDVAALKRLESFVKNKIEIGWLEDQDLVTDFVSFPYTYDPKSKLNDIKRGGSRDSSRRNSGGRGPKSSQKDSNYKGKRGSAKSKDSHYKKSVASDSPAKSNMKSKGAQGAGSQASKKKVSKKAGSKLSSPKSSSKRYKNFKSRGRAESKGLLSWIKNLF